MARLFVIVFGIFGFCWRTGGIESSKYDNYTLIQMHPRNDIQLQALHELQDLESQLEVLKGSRDINDSHDVLVPPDRMEFMQNFAKSHDLPLQVKTEGYGRTLETIERVPRRRVMSGFNVYGYNSYATIQDYLLSIARAYPDMVTLQTLGSSYEGRQIRLVKISTNPNAGNPVIFIDAGIHAREWVAPAMALYLVHRLTHDPDARQNELNGVDWFILPVVNPDGYEYTRTGRANRLWRKTRSRNVANCYGVDGNRNYGFRWGVSGVSSDPCNQETYAGPKPFSEPETQMVRNVMLDNSKRLKLYVSLHSYGQYLVYPWGYTGDYLPKEWKKLDTLARMVSNAVERSGGKPFRVMSAGKWYPAAGGSDDFAYGAVGVPYSYTMELTDGFEFTYPEYRLRQVLPQFYEGFKTFGQQIKKEFSNLRTKRETFE